MKQRLSDMLRAFAASLCAAALMALFLALILSVYSIVRTVDLPVVRWVVLLLALSFVNEIMAPRGTPLLLYAAVNAAVAAVGIGLIVTETVFLPPSEGYPVLLGCMIAASAALNAYYAQKLPDSNCFIRMADLLLIGIGLLMASNHFLSKPANEPVFAFAAAALVLALAASARLRAGGESDNVVRGSGLGGWLVLGVMLAACLAVCGALIVLGGGQIEGIVAVISRIWAGLGRLAEKAVSLFAALLSLNLGKHNVLKREPGHYTVTVVPLNDEQEMGTAPLWAVYGFIGLLALALVALAVALLMDFREKRVLRTGRTGRRRVVTRKSHLLPALIALIHRIADAFRFEAAYRFGKRTPRTLYVFAARRCRGRGLSKRRSESPGAYLNRLHGALLAQGEASSLDRLAADVNEAIYGARERTLSREEYAAYEAQIRKIRLIENPIKKEEGTA